MTSEPRTEELSQAPVPGPGPADDTSGPGPRPGKAHTDINDSRPETIGAPGPELRASGPGPDTSGPGPRASGSNTPGPGPEAPGPGSRWARARAWASQDAEASGLGPRASGPTDTSGPRPEASGPDVQARGPHGRPVVREPRWLKITILLGLWSLTIAGLVLAASGQIEAAEKSGVDDGRQYLAPFVLELNALLWTLMGYRRGRRGNSPNMFWLLAAISGGFSIYLVTNHAPSYGGALLYGGASGAAQLLTFVHLRENLEQFLTDVLLQRGGSRAKYGMLWLTDFGLARRAWLIDVEHSIGVREDTISHAQLYRVVYDGVLANLTSDLSWKNWRKKDRARKLADRTARRYVAIQVGAPVLAMPSGAVEVMEISNVIRAQASGPGPEAPAISGPGPEAPAREIEPGPGPQAPAVPGPGPRAPGPGPQAPAISGPGPEAPVLSGSVVGPEVGPQARGPRPQASGPGPRAARPAAPRKAGPAAVPVSPAPAGPNTSARPGAQTGTDLKLIEEYLTAVSADPPPMEGNVTDLTYYLTDLSRIAERTASWHTGDWLTREECLKKSECITLIGRGSTHGGNVRRIVEAIRQHVKTLEAN